MRTRSKDVRSKKEAGSAGSPSSGFLGATEHTSPLRMTRKMTRTSSNLSTRSSIVVGQEEQPTSTPKQSKKKLSLHFDRSGLVTFKGLTPDQFPDYVPKSDDSAAGSSAKSSKSEVIVNTNGTDAADSMFVNQSTPELVENHDSDLSDEDDADLSDQDLPPPFQDAEWNRKIQLEDCTDDADFEYKRRFPPLTPAEKFIVAMSRKPVGEMSTATLFALAANAQSALVAWQDDWIRCEKRANPYMKQPKPPSHQQKLSGRQFIGRAEYEAQKEAALYNYVHDPKRFIQDPFAQQIGKTDASGRALRRRKEKESEASRLGSKRDTPSDEQEPVGRPKRRAAGKLRDASGAATPEPNHLTVPTPTRGRPGRKRKSEAMIPEESPEYEEPRKRTRATRTSAIPQRIQELKAETSFTGPEMDDDMDLSDSESAMEDGTPSKASTPVTEPMAAASEATPAPESQPKKRGRPKGSKNVNKRSDAGIKKGPRKNYTYKVDLKHPTPGSQETSSTALHSDGAGRAASSIEPADPIKASSLGYGSGPVAPAVRPLTSSVTPETANSMSAGTSVTGYTQQSGSQPIKMASPPRMTGKIAISRLAPQPTSPPDGTPSDSHPPRASASASKPNKPKSAKRSEAMKKWWDERHRNQAAQREAAAAAQAHANAPPPRDGTPINLNTVIPAAVPPPTLPPINPAGHPPHLHTHHTQHTPHHHHAPSASPTYTLPPPLHQGPAPPSRSSSTTPFVAHSHPPIAPAPAPGPGAAGQMSTLNFAPAGNGRGRGSRGGRGRGGRGGGRGRGRGRGGFQNSTVESMAAAAANAKSEARRESHPGLAGLGPHGVE